jgi:hypothetical protein
MIVNDRTTNEVRMDILSREQSNKDPERFGHAEFSTTRIERSQTPTAVARTGLMMCV